MSADGRAVYYRIDTTAQYRTRIPGEFDRLNRQYKGGYKAANCPNEHADKDPTITARPLIARRFVFVSQVHAWFIGDNN